MKIGYCFVLLAALSSAGGYFRRVNCDACHERRLGAGTAPEPLLSSITTGRALEHEDSVIMKNSLKMGCVAALVVATVLASIACVPTLACADTPTAGASSPDMSGARRWVGVYVPGVPSRMASLNALESRITMTPAVVNYFQSTEQPFTSSAAHNAISHGSTPLITLELWDHHGRPSQPAYSLKAITGGSQDRYLTQYARDAKAFGHPVWIRLFHEMNGDWNYPWSGNLNGNTPSDFGPAWRHVWAIFQREGATNVKFVWCPNAESRPNTSANAIGAYWPGDEYVDFIALDGYNWGTTLKNVKWRSFDRVFSSAYSQVVEYRKPIFIAETSCVPMGGDKAAWISDMFDVIPRQYPLICGVSWFNGHTTRDWRIESSPSSTQAFRLGVANGRYSPGFTLRTARSSLSIRTTRTRPKRGQAFTLSGVLTPGQADDRVRVYVKRPGAPSWTPVCERRTNPKASWEYRATLKKRGAYYYQVRYDGDATRSGARSRAIRVAVR
jgi:hypothetical protein